MRMILITSYFDVLVLPFEIFDRRIEELRDAA